MTSPGRRRRVVRVKAYAKINLALRVLGVRPDGYHELRTTFQTIALHDTLTFTALTPVPSGVAGPVPSGVEGPGSSGFQLQIACDDPACPLDRTNLVWRAAEHVWQASSPRAALPAIRVRITKRIPLQSGLGGGSSDAAATLRALANLWRVDRAKLPPIAAALGADVPFFLEGGTALGIERGDVLSPVIDWPASWVVLVLPDFGVSTKDAYAWWDESSPERAVPQPRNDLEAPVAARHPEIARIVKRLLRAGATHAAMSGSGSAVFGLFDRRAVAESAASSLSGRRRRAQLSRTLSRRKFQELSRPVSR